MNSEDEVNSVIVLSYILSHLCSEMVAHIGYEKTNKIIDSCELKDIIRLCLDVSTCVDNEETYDV